MKSIILASASPRRKELLKLLGVKFAIRPGDYEEDTSLPLPPKKLAAHLALGKAKAAAKALKKGIVIGADTIVVRKGKVIGKPRDKKHAFEILANLSGKAHMVITGLAIVDVVSKRSVSRSVISKVHFRELSVRQIKEYIATGEPLDKAGAYAIQGGAAKFVRRIEGDYFNIVGLPLRELADILDKRFGIRTEIKKIKANPPL